MSHSQVEEWILGSRIQSHWPWRMLWPISMLSRILEMLRPAVPSTQAGGNALNSSTAREPSSILRWVSMTRRMYAASLAPRLSRTSWRMASSSMPICSMSASVRWAIGLVWPRTAFFWIVVMSISWGCGGGQASVVDVARAGGGVDAGLHLEVAGLARHGGGDRAVAEVAHAALAKRDDAAHADAHPAAARHQHPGVLGGVEDGRRAVEVERRARAEGDGAAVARLDAGGAELLGGQA